MSHVHTWTIKQNILRELTEYLKLRFEVLEKKILLQDEKELGPVSVQLENAESKLQEELIGLLTDFE